MHSVPFSLVRSIHSTQVHPVEMGWEELVGWLRTEHSHSGPKEELQGWIPAQFNEPVRGEQNVKWVTAGVLDMDKASPAELQQLHHRLQACQLDYVWHTSFRHLRTCGDKAHDTGCPETCPRPRLPKYRFVIRLSKPVAATQWPRIWAGLAELVPGLDTQCRDPGRLYFVPARMPGAPWESGSHEGGLGLDVDAILAHVVETQAPARALSLVGDAPTLKGWLTLGKRNAGGQSAARALGGRAMVALAEAKGEAFAPEGQRDTALYQVGAILAGQYPHTEPALLVAPIREELVRQTQGEKWQEGTAPDELEEKIRRHQAEVKDRSQGTHTARMGQLGRQGPYTEQEITLWCTRLKLRSPEDLSLQLIVSVKGDCYVFFEGEYLHAGSREHAEEFVRHRLQPATSLPGVTLMELDKTKLGYAVKEKPWPQLMRSYGTTVEAISESLTLPHTMVDLTVRPSRLLVACSPRNAACKPEQSSRVAQALQTMVSDSQTHEILLSWLATAPRLERATAALYMHGPKRSGKTQLAEGLAHLWGHRPTELQEAGAAFNEHLTKCPVVFADESLPREWAEDTGKLRRLITSTQHPIREKYRANRNLEGALRVILASNSLHMLAKTHETLEQWDIEAISERILYIPCSSTTPAPHLSRGEIANHILWLEQTHQVTPDGRLWVSGTDSPLHRALRTQGRNRALVCQWLLKFLENPKICDSSQEKYKYDLGPTGLFIAPRLIAHKWDQYLGTTRPLELPQITAALYEIAEKGLKKGLVRVRLEDLYQFATHHTWGIDSLEELQAMVWDPK